MVLQKQDGDLAHQLHRRIYTDGMGKDRQWSSGLLGLLERVVAVFTLSIYTVSTCSCSLSLEQPLRLSTMLYTPHLLQGWVLVLLTLFVCSVGGPSAVCGIVT